MATKKGPRSNALERRFIAEYLVDQNARRAYERAGGSKRWSESSGPRMLRRPHVRAEVDAELKKLEAEVKDRALRVMQITFDRAEFDPGDVFDEQGEPLPMKKMAPAVRRALKKINVVYQDQQVVDERGQPVMNDAGNLVKMRKALVAEVEWHDSKPDRELALKLAGKLKEVVKHEGLTHEEIIREAERRAREAEAEKAE